MKTFYSAVKYTLLLLVAALLLKLSFREVEWALFIEGLSSAKWALIALSMGSAGLATLFRALRWKLVMEPLNSEVTLIESWHALNIGYLTNFIIPRGGELSRCAVITQSRKIPFKRVAGTVILERAIDLLSLFIITVATLLLGWEQFGGFFKREILTAEGGKMWLQVLSLLAVAFLIILLFALLFKKRLKRYRLFQKIYSFFEGVIEGVVAGAKMEKKWSFWGYTVAIWGCYWVMSLLTILAFPGVEGLGMIDALFLMVVGSFGWVVPVQGGIGAYHFIISLALTTIYAIDSTSAIVFATISHEAQALVMILLGLLSFIALTIREKRENKE